MEGSLPLGKTNEQGRIQIIVSCVIMFSTATPFCDFISPLQISTGKTASPDIHMAQLTSLLPCPPALIFCPMEHLAVGLTGNRVDSHTPKQ